MVEQSNVARSRVTGSLMLGALSIGEIGVRTSATVDVPAYLHRFGGATNSGIPVDVVKLASEPIAPAGLLRGLHSAAGLSWNQVAVLLGVSRRSVHAWVAGAVMRPLNRQRLDELVELAERHADDGPAAVRAALFAAAHLPGPPIRLDVLLERGEWVDVPHVFDDAPMTLE